jgi:hypothetical protein
LNGLKVSKVSPEDSPNFLHKQQTITMSIQTSNSSLFPLNIQLTLTSYRRDKFPPLSLNSFLHNSRFFLGRFHLSALENLCVFMRLFAVVITILLLSTPIEALGALENVFRVYVVDVMCQILGSFVLEQAVGTVKVVAVIWGALMLQQVVEENFWFARSKRAHRIHALEEESNRRLL